MSLIYGDYYFLEALVRLEALRSRELLVKSQHIARSGGNVEFTFERTDPAPPLAFRVQRSSDLSSWAVVAAKTGAASWTASDGVAITEEAVCPGRMRVRVQTTATGDRSFFRIATRSTGDAIW